VASSPRSLFSTDQLRGRRRTVRIGPGVIDHVESTSTRSTQTSSQLFAQCRPDDNENPDSERS
jgi:hypothetical protein